jgi:hypothetical protein
MKGKKEGLTLIHGSHGEGRGQVFRTSLVVLAIPPKPISIHQTILSGKFKFEVDNGRRSAGWVWVRA